MWSAEYWNTDSDTQALRARGHARAIHACAAGGLPPDTQALRARGHARAIHACALGSLASDMVSRIVSISVFSLSEFPIHSRVKVSIRHRILKTIKDRVTLALKNFL